MTHYTTIVIPEAERAKWLADAKTAVPAVAWAAYKRRTSTTNEPTEK